MADETSRPKLEVVRTPKREMVQPEDFTKPDQQGVLFASPRPGLLIFVYFPDVTEDEFRNTVMHAKPAQIVELRSAPRFDIGNLNRQSAFRLFSEQNAVYIDLPSSVPTTWDVGHLLSYLESFIRNSHLSAERPLMILLNKANLESGMEKRIRRLISSAIPQFTELFEVPHFSQIGSWKAKSASF